MHAHVLPSVLSTDVLSFPAKGVCRSLFSRSHSVSYEVGQQVGAKRKREQEEVEKHTPKRQKSEFILCAIAVYHTV